MGGAGPSGSGPHLPLGIANIPHGSRAAESPSSARDPHPAVRERRRAPDRYRPVRRRRAGISAFPPPRADGSRAAPGLSGNRRSLVDAGGRFALLLAAGFTETSPAAVPTAPPIRPPARRWASAAGDCFTVRCQPAQTEATGDPHPTYMSRLDPRFARAVWSGPVSGAIDRLLAFPSATEGSHLRRGPKTAGK